MDKKTIIIMRSWKQSIDCLPDDVKLEAFAALAEYAVSGEMPQLSPMANTAFEFMKCAMESTFKEKELSKRRKAKVSVAETQKNAILQQNDANTQNYGNMQQNELSTHGSPPARVIEDNINNKESLDNIDYQKIKKENAQKKENEKDATNAAHDKDDKDDKVDARVFIDYFNIEMDHAGAVIPHNVKYTKMRASAINSRCREHGKEALAAMVHKAARSDFLNGRNSGSWTATFDWLLRPNNFVKVIEGNYDNNGSLFANDSKNNSKNKNYGEQHKPDPRRGFEPTDHTAEEYAREV